MGRKTTMSRDYDKVQKQSDDPIYVGIALTHCGRVMQICVFNTLKLGTSASSP